MSNLAGVLNAEGRVADASALSEKLAQMEPDPPFSFFNRGLKAMRERDFKDARDLFAREVNRAPYYHEFHFWLAAAYIGLGQTDDAQRELNLAIEYSTSRNERDLYAAKLDQDQGAPGCSRHTRASRTGQLKGLRRRPLPGYNSPFFARRRRSRRRATYRSRPECRMLTACPCPTFPRLPARPTSGRCASSTNAPRISPCARTSPQPPSTSSRPRRDADRLRRRRLRLRRDQRHCPAPDCRPRSTARGVGARERAALADRFAHAAPRRRRAANTPRLMPMRGLVAPRVVRAARRRVARGRMRFAHRRLGSERRDAHARARLPDQRRRRRRPALSLRHAQPVGHRACRRRHADAHAQRLPRPRAAGRRGDARPLRLRRQRRGASPTRRCSCWPRRTARPAPWTSLLMPDQMMLQIHESIGHPLELDRILGDERNFAGTSFVTLDMFGTYRYGSDLLNVTLRSDARREELASYAFDDDGTPRREGVPDPQRHSRAAAGRRDLAGARRDRRASPTPAPTAGTGRRSIAWPTSTSSRATPSLDAMIAGIDHGVLMATNSSWSIDDSRNKFQFGCEWGQLIENGKLTTVVKNPNYRGISANFWRSLTRVGDASTLQVLGHAVLRQGRAVAGDPRRPRVAGVRVHRRRRVRRRRTDALHHVERWKPISTSSPRFSTARSRRARSTPARFDAEVSDFVRMNRGKIRQPGSVDAALSAPASDPRRASTPSSASTCRGDLARDREPLPPALAALRDTLCRPSRRSASATTRPTSTRAASCGATRCRAPKAIIATVLDAADGPRSGRHLRGGAGLPRFRQFARPAQLARSDELQPAVEPLPPRGQGGEDGVQRLRLVGSGVRRENARRPRASGAAGRAGALARTGKLPRLPHADGDGGDRRHAVLGRILRARAGDAAELPVPDAGWRGGARRLA